MFEINAINGSNVSFTAAASESEYSVLPTLTIKMPVDTAGYVIEYIIQRANTNLCGYYVHKNFRDEKGFLVDTHIATGYLPKDKIATMPAEAAAWIPDIVKGIVRSYVQLTLANLFSQIGLRFTLETYNNQDFPAELKDAIEKFVGLEYDQLIGKKAAEETVKSTTKRMTVEKFQQEADKTFDRFFGEGFREEILKGKNQRKEIKIKMK